MDFNKTELIDLEEIFSKLENPLNMFYKKEYSENYNVYSKHYSAKGNKLVAEKIKEIIK